MIKLYLYAKQHNVTGMRYFGVTKKDPYKYIGSGTYWKKHLATHGRDVTTTWVQEYTDKKVLMVEATFFSQVYDIANSDEWANLIPENGDSPWKVKTPWNKGLTGTQTGPNRKKGHPGNTNRLGKEQSIEEKQKRSASIKAWWAERKGIN